MGHCGAGNMFVEFGKNALHVDCESRIVAVYYEHKRMQTGALQRFKGLQNIVDFLMRWGALSGLQKSKLQNSRVQSHLIILLSSRIIEAR